MVDLLLERPTALTVGVTVAEWSFLRHASIIHGKPSDQAFSLPVSFTLVALLSRYHNTASCSPSSHSRILYIGCLIDCRLTSSSKYGPRPFVPYPFPPLLVYCSCLANNIFIMLSTWCFPVRDWNIMAGEESGTGARRR